MSITWINTAAFAGLALVAFPIAIHLLVRQQTRVLAFPSLRFLHETALAAFRRRAIQDAVLLACRLAIVAAAVAALAGPVVRTASRDAADASRISRAIVIAGDAGDAREVGDRSDGGEVDGAFRSATFRRVSIADAIADALRWLDAQPPSRREISFMGELRRGAVESGDLLLVPAEVGIRFVERPPAAVATVQATPRLTRRDGVLVRVDQQVRLDGDATRVEDGASRSVPADRVRILAAPSAQALADAALATALDEGVPWTADDRPVVIVWEGAAVAELPADAVIVRMAVPEPASASATAVWTELVRAMPRAIVEPALIPREQLTAWSRPGGRPSPDAIPGDEGDRRWFWAAALALMALEYVLRRDRVRTVPDADVKAEARVA